MYDELVKRLRMRARLFKQINQMENCIMDEAADAIEELQQIAAHYEESAKDYFKDVCYYLERVPKWIPVTERLPSNDDFVIVTVKDESGDSAYVYSDFGWFLDRAECWIVETEQRTDITHWMPLPEPPKEET